MARTRTFATRLVPPPCEKITPTLAAGWLRTIYPRLRDFAGLAAHPTALRPPRLREDLRLSLTAIGADVDEIADACIVAVTTRRSVPIKLERGGRVRSGTRRRLRAAIDYERKWNQDAAARAVLLRTLRSFERATAALVKR